MWPRHLMTQRPASVPSFQLCLVPRLLMGGDRVVSGKALKARGSVDGWQGDTGDDREREHRQMRATLNTQECEPLFMSVCIRPCFYSFYFVVWVALGPGPPGGRQGGHAQGPSSPGSGPLSSPLHVGVFCFQLPISISHQELPYVISGKEEGNWGNKRL